MEWPSHSDGSLEKVEVSTSPRFDRKSLTVEGNLQNTQFELAIPEGAYFLRETLRQKGPPPSREEKTIFRIHKLRIRASADADLGKSLTLIEGFNGVLLSWKPIPGATDYDVVLWKDQKFTKKFHVKGRNSLIAKLPAGTYGWTVLDAARAPASVGADANSDIPPIYTPDTTKGPPFAIGPVPRHWGKSMRLISPEGRLVYSPVPVPFAWQNMGADYLYDVHLFKATGSGRWRELASATNLTQTSTPQLTDDLPPGRYRWQVEAYPASEQAQLPSVSTQDFRVESPDGTEKGSGWLEVGFVPGRMSYQGNNSSFSSSFSASLAGPYVSAAYFLLDRWKVRFSYQTASFTFQSENSTYSEASLGVAYAGKIGRSGQFGYNLGLGMVLESLPEVLTPDGANYTVGQLSQYSLSPLVRFSYRVEPRTELYVSAEPHFILSFSGGSNSDARPLQKILPWRISSGLRGTWLWPWGISAGASYWTDRAVYSSGGDTIQLNMNLLEFRLGIFYVF